MTARFDGRTAIITGASQGIGLSIARRLVREGARVVITARKQELLDEAIAQLGGPSHAIAVAGRASDADHQREAVGRALDTFGSADILVNNAGINPTFGPMIEMDPGVARKVFEVNCLAALTWTQVTYQAWMGVHGGAIVNISSVAGLRPAPGIAMYGASKAMLTHITQALAVELGPDIRVNAVAPATVKTKFASALYEGKEEVIAADYPLKRLGMPEDIAGVVAFLSSEDAKWMTGHLVVVDGGISLTGGA